MRLGFIRSVITTALVAKIVFFILMTYEVVGNMPEPLSLFCGVQLKVQGAVA